MARPFFPRTAREETRAARLALQDYLAAWARQLTIIVAGRPRKLTPTEVQRVAYHARPRPGRRGVRAGTRVEGVS